MNAKAAAGIAWVLSTAAMVVLLLPLMIAGAATGSPPPALCGPGGTAQSVGDVQLDAEQMGNAQSVVSAVAQRGFPSYAATIALATVAQESMFHNYLVFKDADSLGLFQQRVRFYTAAVAANPTRATNAFLDKLVEVNGWATLPLTEAAATVQRPRQDLRGAYAKWQPLAATLTAQLWPRTAATTSTAAAASLTAPPPGQAPPDPCGVAGTGPGGGSDVIPHGLALTGSPAGNRAARFALAQLGKPYVYGSNGPNSWDCSSLTQASWASAGVAIARTTFAQVNDGTPVTPAAARSGDLVFIAGTGGTPQNPGHVGMVAGRVGATIYLVAAPRTGEVVQMTPAAQWASQIVSVRRIG
ncbi:MAG: NlpC/P60 family protein [Actinomycetota bacterium]